MIPSPSIKLLFRIFRSVTNQLLSPPRPLSPPQQLFLFAFLVVILVSSSLLIAPSRLRSELGSTTAMLNESRGSLEQMTRTQGALKESLGSTQKTSESIVVKLQV